MTGVPGRLRRRRAQWEAVQGCPHCWEHLTVGTALPDSTGLRPIRVEGAPRVTPGLPVAQTWLELLDLHGAAEIEYVGREPAHIQWVDDAPGTVVSVVPGASAIASGWCDQPVRCWGACRSEAGGRVVGAPGAQLVLAGGAAATGDRARLIARAGRGVAGPGSTVVMEPAEPVQVWVLPGAQLTVGGVPRLVATTTLATAEEVREDERVPEDLGRLLRLAEALPVRRRA
ncbi:hypothetical protein [Actinomyces sp.]|uniref:hypothetical protein n=1 Tax=Actinomyces sp. TaxID=29317 RepID=UPI0026DC986C|nr:hypothetical protein [Actinomyces sp.]MDO4900839.1 hypothetical protein [Actinomyces sp.]